MREGNNTVDEGIHISIITTAIYKGIRTTTSKCVPLLYFSTTLSIAFLAPFSSSESIVSYKEKKIHVLVRLVENTTC